MKVTQDSTFKPVVITLETPEELQHIRNLMSHDVTIPKAVHPVQTGDRNALQDFMMKMYDGVRYL